MWYFKASRQLSLLVQPKVWFCRYYRFGPTLLGIDVKRKSVICAVKVVSVLGGLSPPWTNAPTSQPGAISSCWLCSVITGLSVCPQTSQFVLTDKQNEQSCTRTHTHTVRKGRRTGWRGRRGKQAGEVGSEPWPLSRRSRLGGGLTPQAAPVTPVREGGKTGL